MSEAEISQTVEELQVLQRVIADLQARLLTVQKSIVEHEEAVKLIEEIRRSGEKTKILVPLGAGTFAEARFESIEKVTVSLGAGVYAVKALGDTQQILMRRSQNLQALFDNLSKRIGEYTARAEELRELLGRFLSAQRRQGT